MNQIQLNPTAAKILIAILLYGDDFLNATVPMQMGVVGCPKRETFRHARRELAEAGYIVLDERSGTPTRMKLYTPDNVNGNAVLLLTNYISLINRNTGFNEGVNSVSKQVSVPLNGRANNILPANLAPQPSPVSGLASTGGWVEGSPLNGLGSEGGPLKGLGQGARLERADAADNLDNSGDLMLVKSPAAIRRKQQIEVIIEAYAEIFPHENPLTTDMAKKYLRLRNESAVDVIDGIEDIVRRKPDLTEPKENGGVRTYILKVFEGDAAKGVFKPAPVVDRSNEFAGKVQPGEMREPDAGYLERLMAKRARKAASPIEVLLEGDFDNDNSSISTGISNTHEGRGRGTGATANEGVRDALGVS